MQKISIIKNRSIVLVLSLCALIIPVVLIELNVLKVTNGILVYPLDDTYIHMSIAKNLMQYKNWGISSNEFQSASSSILYTLLLCALFKLFSVNIIIPVAINLIAGIVLLFIIQKKLQKEHIGFTAQFIILLLVIFLTPLPILIISGMEHTLQCLFSILFIFNFSDWISKQEIDLQKKHFPVSLFIYGIILCMIRYEGLFIIAISCCTLLYYKKIIPAFALGFISVLPLIIFGIYSITKGSYFLPNSVIVKSRSPELSVSGLIEYASNILIYGLTIPTTGIPALSTQRLLIILPLVFLFFGAHIKNKVYYKLIIIILFACTILQLSFASTGWFYRYEAYLIMCSTVIITILFVKYFTEWYKRHSRLSFAVVLVISFFLFFPAILRSGAAYSKAGQACINIYEQQCQMANFIKKYYNADTIGLNDIGAVSFFSKAKVIDFAGLANIEIARARKTNTLTPEFLDAFVNNEHVNIAIVYDIWFDSAVLNKWNKVATWQISNNVICGDSTVSFYAVKPESAALLKENLLAYQKSMPETIKVKFY